MKLMSRRFPPNRSATMYRSFEAVCILLVVLLSCCDALLASSSRAIRSNRQLLLHTLTRGKPGASVQAALVVHQAQALPHSLRSANLELRSTEATAIDSFHVEEKPTDENVATRSDTSFVPTRDGRLQRVLKHALSKVAALKKNLGYRSVRRRIAMIALVLALSFGRTASAWAVSGGRMGGGSFKPSSSRSSGSMGGTSTYSRPSGRVYLPPSRVQHHHHYGPPLPIIVNSFSNGRGWYAPTHESAIVNTRMTTKDIVVLTGVGALLVYGIRNNFQRNNNYGDGGLLGPGFTVGSMTVALDVPNRGDPNNILSKLSRLSVTADTSSRKGVRELLSAVALELLRQERAVTSAYTQFNQYPITGQAEREFQVLSVQSQSKVDRLTVNKFDSQDKSDANSTKGKSSSAPTVAIVTINFAIEGDSTKLPVIRTRDDLRGALLRISSDAQVGECLLTAEVLWSPEDSSETLSREAAYADFPNLVPI